MPVISRFLGIAIVMLYREHEPPAIRREVHDASRGQRARVTELSPEAPVQ